MSGPQTPKKSLNAFKDELYGALRQIESDFKLKFNELESKLKTDIENFSSKINLLSQENKVQSLKFKVQRKDCTFAFAYKKERCSSG